VDLGVYNPLDPSNPPPVLFADQVPRPTPLRRVRVVALPGPASEFVVVEGTRGMDFALYRIHVRTGALETVHRESVEGWLLCDRQGRPRLRLTNLGIPQRWSLRAIGDSSGRWKPLGRDLAPPDTNAFDVAETAFFGSRAFPLGFDEDPNLLYYASNAGRDTHGVYQLDLRTDHRTPFALEHPSFDLANPVGGPAGAFGNRDEAVLVFDRATRSLAGVRYLGLRSTTRWLDATVAEVQRHLEGKHPTSSIQIEHWDANRSRFLVHLFSRSDPGSYAIFDAPTGRFSRVVARGPAASPLQPMRTVPWGFETAAGLRLTGEITLPLRPRSTPVPVVVFFRQSEWSRQFMRYNPQVAVLAHLGFAVLEVNHRGLAGFGTGHWAAGRLRADVVAAEDAMAALDHLAGRLRLESGKVIFFGAAVGGYFAWRAAQLMPERTAAVATINPVLDLPDWISPPVELSFQSQLLYAARRWYFGPDAKTRRLHSPLHHAPAVGLSALIVSTSDSPYFDGEEMRKKTRSAGGALHLVRIPREPDPATQGARAMAAIAEYLTRSFRSASPTN
jgi:pimeloyl-ACP methyl ester carboxylesterase